MTDKPKRGRPITTGKTPLRGVRIPDAEWAALQAKATRAGFVSIAAWLIALAREK